MLRLDELCAYTSITPGSRWLLLLLLLYAPLGAVLFAIRLVTAAAVATLLTLLPSSLAEPVGTIALRLLCAVFGFVIRTRCVEAADTDSNTDAHDGTVTPAARLARAQIVVANHLSQADSWPFRCFNPIAVLVRDTYRGTSRLMPVAKLTAAAFHPIFVPTPGSRSEAEERDARSAAREAVAAHVAAPRAKPLLAFPEGSITNGRGLMRFSSFVFGLEVQHVQPTAILTRYLLLATCYSLLATCYSLLATRYLLLATRYLLLAACYWLLATCYSLLAT